MTILILNGPNLNLLGKREPHIYGSRTFADYLAELRAVFSPSVTLEYFQSNHEGELIDQLQAAAGISGLAGVVLNAGALSHTSIALADAITATGLKVVEVHISNIFAREAFRHHSWLSPVSVGIISGLGLEGYGLAVRWLVESREA